jgi:hypothetical protein
VCVWREGQREGTDRERWRESKPMRLIAAPEDMQELFVLLLQTFSILKGFKVEASRKVAGIISFYES